MTSFALAPGKRPAMRAGGCPGLTLQRKGSACGSRSPAGESCAACQGTARSLQRRSISPDGGTAHEAAPIGHEMPRSSGAPLGDAGRRSFKSRFNHDFSGVRVHSGARDAASAGAVGAVHARANGAGLPEAALPADRSPAESAPSLPGGPTESCSITSAKFDVIPSGTLVPTLSRGRLETIFPIAATFSAPDSCTCANGEYRQYIRGEMTQDGVTNDVWLTSDTLLEKARWREDGNKDGFRYGHRQDPSLPWNEYVPDHQTGCKFVGRDEPGLIATSGRLLSIDLDFRGDLIDTGRTNWVLASTKWRVSGSALVP